MDTGGQFISFNEEVIKGDHVEPYRTSWPIAAPDINIAGTVDFLGRFPDGTYGICLWRRSKTLEDNLLSSYNKLGRFPVEHLDDCEGSKCYLQLNFLKFILENYYKLQVTRNNEYSNILLNLLIIHT